MANELITPEEMLSSITHSVHAVAQENGLTQEEEEFLLYSICATIGTAQSNTSNIKKLS